MSNGNDCQSLCPMYLIVFIPYAFVRGNELILEQEESCHMEHVLKCLRISDGLRGVQGATAPGPAPLITQKGPRN